MAAERLGLKPGDVRKWKILRRSIDARGKREPSFIYSLGLDVECGDEVFEISGVAEWREPEPAPLLKGKLQGFKPIVVGFGPAGMFAALRLLELGSRPVVIERGSPVEERIRDVAAYWRNGFLNSESNVQFGEGGAGTFSDGKLTYRGKDCRKNWVLEKFMAAGAPEEISFDAKPHLGTDKLRGIVKTVRAYLLKAGCDIRFHTRAERLIFSGNAVIGVETDKGPITGAPVFLAPGHSARKFIREIVGQGVAAQAKAFAMGVRVELPQSLVDQRQYGAWAKSPFLPRAEFFVNSHAPQLRDVYSFCMCPGGTVIPAGSEPEGLVVNGMSGSSRGGRWANAAIVTPVEPSDFGGSALEGFNFQQRWERAAQSMAGPCAAPAQMLADFLEGRTSRNLPESSCPWKLKSTGLDKCLPEFVSTALIKAVPALLRKLDILSQGLLIGVETRTSSPVRLTRDSALRAIGVENLYPVGEGAGYAGGIVSCAIDGAKAVDAFIAEMKNKDSLTL